MTPGRARAQTDGATPAPARSLAEWLRGWTDEALASLVAARPDLALPVPSDMGVLASRVADRVHVARAIDGLDRFTQQVLEALLLLEAPATAESVSDLLGVDASPALATLSALALIWDSPRVRPVQGVAAVLPRPAGVGRPALTLLRRTERPVVAGMLTAHGQVSGGDPDDATARLARIVAASPAGNDDDEREILAAVDAGGGIGSVTGALRPADPDDASPVRRLLARGLLIPVDADTVELPREIGLKLRGGLVLPAAEPQPPTLETVVARGDVDDAGALVAAEAVRAVDVLLAEWSTTPPSERKSGGLGQRDLKAAARILGSDEQTAALVADIAYAAGLLGRTTAVDSSFAPTTDYDDWLRGEVPARWARLAAGWLRSPGVTSAVGGRDDHDQVVTALYRASYRPVVREVRRAVLDVLAAAPDGSIPTDASIRARLDWQAPRRARAREALIGPTLTEAAWLGVTGAGGLTSYGRALMADPDGGPMVAAALAAALPEPVHHVLLQADLTAVAPGPLPAELAAQMAALADIESAGSATVYRFSPASLRRALDGGQSAGDVHAFLAHIASTAVPQALTYLVDDTARRHGQMRVGTASSYIRCDDETLLTEVIADRACASLRLRRIAPTVLISAVAGAALLDGLRRAGYAPVGERADGGVRLGGPTPTRAGRPGTVAMPEQGLDPASAARVVASLRAGDRVVRATPATDRPGGRSDRGISSTLALLDRAMTEGRPVLLGYVNAQGQDSRRIVEPQAMSGGLVTAYDQKTQERRSFALHRITEVSLLETE